MMQVNIQKAPQPLLSPHSASTNHGIIDDFDQSYFFQNGNNAQGAAANGNLNENDDEFAWLDNIFVNEEEAARAVENAKINILTFTGSPPPTSPGYSSTETSSPLTSATSTSASVNMSTTSSSKSTTSPPPIIPVSSIPIAGENPWNIDLKTAFGNKYWRTDKKTLHCFPFCTEFGLDYRTIKLEGLNHTRKPCLAAVEGSFYAPKDLQLRNVLILGRFLMVSPQLCASEGRKLFHVGDVLQQSDIDAELNDCGLLGRISLVRNGVSNNNISGMKLTQPTICDFEFTTKEWKANVPLPKTRRKQNDNTTIPLYSYEALILLVDQSGKYILVSRYISVPFQIISLRTLLREVAAKDGQNMETSSNSDASAAAVVPPSKPKTQTKKKENANNKPPVSVVSSNSIAPLSQSSVSTSISLSSAANSNLPSNLTKRGHESGRNNEDDIPLDFGFDGEEIPQDLFTEQELFDLDKILEDVPPQDRKKVRTQFVQEAQRQKQEGRRSSLQNIMQSGGIQISKRPQEVTNNDHPLAPAKIGNQTTQESSKSVIPSAAASAPPYVSDDDSNIIYSLQMLAANPNQQGPSSAASAVAIPSHMMVPISDYSVTVPSAPIPHSDDRISFNTNQAQNYHEQYSLEDAYVFWLALGVFGGHHYYLGRYNMGIMYTITLAGFGFGWIIDAIFMSSHVERANTNNQNTIYPEFMFFFAPPLGLLGVPHYIMGNTRLGMFYTCTFGGFGFAWISDLFRLNELWKIYRIQGYRKDFSQETYTYERHLQDAKIVHMPLGVFGAHHFFLGDYKLGFLYLFTFGLLGIGFIRDIFRLPMLVTESRIRSNMI